MISKKFLSSLLLLLALAVPSLAGPVSERMAHKKADAFLKEKGCAAADRVLNLAYRAKVAENAENAYFYVYNRGNGKGFVILSGDDQTVPVLAYADHGYFDSGNLPPNLKWWMDYYKEAVREVAERNLSNAPAHARPTDVIQPLLKTKWDQDGPYNGMCPVINGTRCPTGCVATAMAQVINYHRCPSGESAAIPGYTTQTHHQHMSSLPATTFDWDNMKNTYNNNSSQESKDAVAKLMLYCGQAVQMDYTPSSSGALTDDLGSQMPRYFKFPWTIHSVSREGYTIAQWDSLLIRELVNNRPVLYTGYTSAWEGHAFVCDGYDGKGFYHINWGWGGAADGHYRISVLDATANGIGGSSTSLRFNVMQSALVGVQVEGEDEYAAPSKDVSVTRPSLKYGGDYTREDISKDFGPIVIAQSFVNVTDRDSHKNYFTLGMGLFDDEGVMVKKLASTSTYLWNGYPSIQEFSLQGFGKDLENGHFTIQPLFGTRGNDLLPTMNAEHYYVDVIIDGNRLTLTPVPKADFVVTRVRKSGSNVVVNLTNNGGEFCGDLLVRKIMADGSIGDVAAESVCIEENSSREIAIYVDDNHSLDLDKDVYYLSTDFYEDQYFYCNVTNEGAKLECSIQVDNLSEDGGSIVGDEAFCTCVVSNVGEQLYNHYFSLALVNTEDERLFVDRKIIRVSESASVTLQTKIPLTEFGEGYRLEALAYEGKDEVPILSSDPYTIAKGAIYWTANGEMHTQVANDVFHVPDDALTINLRNAFTRNVVPNDNPNTVYLLDQTVPKGLSDKNVFNFENKGGYLTIHDGYDFFTPVELDVTMSIKFVRSFSSEDPAHWTSLILPFAPVRIQVEGKNIGWFRNAEDYGKDLWIERISKVRKGVVDLDYVDELRACQPYLMAINENLAGKTVEFIGQKILLQPTSEINMGTHVNGYDFKGLTRSAQSESVFLLDGQAFVYDEGIREIKPFRVYVEGGSSGVKELTVNGPDILSHITDLTASHTMDDADVYYLNGIRAGKYRDLKNLGKGIYICNGMKLVVR